MNNKEKYYLAKLARRGRKTNIVEPPVQVELEDPTPPIVELPEAPDNSDWGDKIPEWMKKVRLGPGGPHNKKPPLEEEPKVKKKTDIHLNFDDLRVKKVPLSEESTFDIEEPLGGSGTRV